MQNDNQQQQHEDPDIEQQHHQQQQQSSSSPPSSNAQHRSNIPKLPLIPQSKQQQQAVSSSTSSARGQNNKNYNYSPLVVTTSSRTKYILSNSVLRNTNNNNGTTARTTSSTAATQNDRRFLDQSDLRSIRNYVKTNKMRPHSQRTGKIKDFVPDSPFVELQDRPADDAVNLSLAPINENESALDVPLRFAAPANLHAPAAADAARGLAAGSRLLSTLKGSAGLQPHWDTEKVGAEKDYAHVVMLRDASLKSEAAKRSGDLRKFSAAQHVLGVLHYNANLKAKALPFFRAAAELAARGGDNQWRALNENLACCSLMKLERYKEASAYAATTAQYCGPFGKAVCFNNAGVCHSHLHDYDTAKQCFEGALRNAAITQDSVLDTISRGNLACAQLRLGELAEAQGNFERCLEVCSVAGDSVGSSVILVLLGETLGASGDFKRSIFFFEQAMRIANEAKCFEIAKVAQTSIGITKAIGGAQLKITNGSNDNANSSSDSTGRATNLTSRDILAALK